MKDGYTISYGSRHSVLLINSLGRIRELYTPFRVKVVEEAANLVIGSYIYVEEVDCSQDGQLLYITENGPFVHSNFRIVASF